jgi:hypothetical protein
VGVTVVSSGGVALTDSGRALLQAEVDRLQANADVGQAMVRQGLAT